jgi:hypothetical protein
MPFRSFRYYAKKYDLARRRGERELESAAEEL